MNLSKLLLVLGLGAGLLAQGCGGKKRIEGTEIPTQPPVQDIVLATPMPTPQEAPPEPPPVAAEPTPEPANPCGSYIVVKGDTLWDISAMGLGYKDNFQWPLIFKANRDQITDPDLIYPKQEFCIRHDFTQIDIDKARKDASDTPKYVPHTKPREVLPVDYF